MPRGKTPSLIGGSLGKPQAAIAGRESPCSRCKKGIPMKVKCVDVPQLRKRFASTRRFCIDCFLLVLEQTRHDLEGLSDLTK